MERRNQLVSLDSLLQPLMAPAPTTVLSQLFRTLWSSVVRPATGYLHHLVFVEDDHGAPHQSHHGPPEGWYVLMDRVKVINVVIVLICMDRLIISGGEPAVVGIL
jgi:hypothetical protein